MTWYVIFLIVVAATVLVMIAAGTAMFFSFGVLSDNYKKKKHVRDAWEENEDLPEDVVLASLCLPYRDELIEGRRWVKSHELKNFSVTSYDGLRLAAKFIRPENMRGIVLMMHGFRSSPIHDFPLAVKEFYEMGIGCMMPYQRAHGTSEGKYLYYGTKERYDVVSWCELIEKEFPDVPVILDGISMGAATVLMASGLELPKCVKGIIADCGYTSPRDIFVHVIKNRFGIPTFPFLHTTSLYAKIRAGFSIKSVSTVNELKKNRLPLLIAHGEDDSIVPHSMSVENFEAAREHCDVTFLSVPGAEHGLSFLTDREEYLKEVKTLIVKCIN